MEYTADNKETAQRVNSKSRQSGGRKKPKVPKKISERYLHNSGLYYLQRFTASKAHFKSVMMRKVKRSCAYHKDQDFDECAQWVEALADNFEELGLLNDALYTRGMVTSLRRRGLSRSAIFSKLRSKGLTKDQISSGLEAYNEETGRDSGEQEFRSALMLARKKRVGPYRRSEEFEYKKELGVLARAGFSFDIAQRIVGMSAEEIDEYMDDGMLRPT